MEWEEIGMQELTLRALQCVETGERNQEELAQKTEKEKSVTQET